MPDPPNKKSDGLSSTSRSSTSIHPLPRSPAGRHEPETHAYIAQAVSKASNARSLGLVSEESRPSNPPISSRINRTHHQRLLLKLGELGARTVHKTQSREYISRTQPTPSPLPTPIDQSYTKLHQASPSTSENTRSPIA